MKVHSQNLFQNTYSLQDLSSSFPSQRLVPSRKKTSKPYIFRQALSATTTQVKLSKMANSQNNTVPTSVHESEPFSPNQKPAFRVLVHKSTFTIQAIRVYEQKKDVATAIDDAEEWRDMLPSDRKRVLRILTATIEHDENEIMTSEGRNEKIECCRELVEVLTKEERDERAVADISEKKGRELGRWDESIVIFLLLSIPVLLYRWLTQSVSV